MIPNRKKMYIAELLDENYLALRNNEIYNEKVFSIVFLNIYVKYFFI